MRGEGQARSPSHGVNVRYLTALLALVVLLTGCAANTRYALEQFPTRTEAMWTDPVRREHFVTHVGLEMSTVGVGMTCAVFVPFPFSLGVCPLVAVIYNFGMYEFILEPQSKSLVEEGKPSKVGPYWERGPRDGEVFINP